MPALGGGGVRLPLLPPADRGVERGDGHRARQDRRQARRAGDPAARGGHAHLRRHRPPLRARRHGAERLHRVRARGGTAAVPAHARPAFPHLPGGEHQGHPRRGAVGHGVPAGPAGDLQAASVLHPVPGIRLDAGGTPHGAGRHLVPLRAHRRQGDARAGRRDGGSEAGVGPHLDGLLRRLRTRRGAGARAPLRVAAAPRAHGAPDRRAHAHEAPQRRGEGGRRGPEAVEGARLASPLRLRAAARGAPHRHRARRR